MVEISGTVEDEAGNVIDGATVYLVRESDDTIAGVQTTGAAGTFDFTGLTESETYHVTASYSDGSTYYAGDSAPYITPFTDAGIIDNWEDGDIAEYSGNKLSYDVQTDRVQDGTYALEMSNDDGEEHTITSQSGLPRYPVAGNSFSYRSYFEGQVSLSSVFFGVQDSKNYYKATIDSHAGEMRIESYVSGTPTTIAADPVSLPTGEWLEPIVIWDSDGSLTFRVLDSTGSLLNDIGGTNTDYIDGGIGWGAATGSFSGNSVFIDYAKLTSASTSPLAVDTTSPTDVGDHVATLNGELLSTGGADSVSVFFEYREVGAATWNTTGSVSVSDTVAFSEAISGLSGATDYEYRAVADTGSEVATGDTLSFTTSDIGAELTTNAPTDVTYNDATLNGTVDSLGTLSSLDVYFQISESGSTDFDPLETAKTEFPGTGSYSDSITGLSEDTSYISRFVADGSGGEFFAGDFVSFTTPIQPLTVSSVGESNIESSSVTLEGSLDSLGGASSVDCYFEFRETGATSWQTTALQTLSNEASFTEDVSGLSSSTDYEWRATGDASDGNTDDGSIMSFTTKAPPPEGLIGAPGLESFSGVDGDFGHVSSPTWDTDTALQIQGSGVEAMHSYEGDGLGNYPGPGDTVKFRIYVQDAELGLGVGLNDGGSVAAVLELYNSNFQDLNLRRISSVDGNDYNSGTSISYSWTTGTWVTLVMEYYQDEVIGYVDGDYDPNDSSTYLTTNDWDETWDSTGKGIMWWGYGSGMVADGAYIQ